MITTLLIANRGEIACRIMRTCDRLGIRTVAVYAQADAQALHVHMATEAIAIGPSPASESYLRGAAIVDAALRCGADAVHPGYGFLAEQSAFAQACVDAGLCFVGPDPATIAALGNKHAARERMAQVGVPVLPGYGGADQSDERLRAEAGRIGYPVMVKAAAGGGGRGMRLVVDDSALLDALAAARREALQAFGSDELVLERAVLRPRHIEFQIFGDRYGGMVHVGERECSVQRRYQKVIEETPSVALTPGLRAAMGAAAVAVGRAVGYVGAGTVEFLLDADGAFYFLEVNTRLQVEHPITECVTGLDLVEWQIRVAEGQPLPLSQEQVLFRGCAIEARLCAEDAAQGCLPVTGRVLRWGAPVGEGVRTDTGIQSGDVVTMYYDSLLAKVIAFGPDRASVVRRLSRALELTRVVGMTTNQALLQAILAHPDYRAGAVTTAFLAEQFATWRAPDVDQVVVLSAVSLVQWQQQAQVATNQGYWRNNPAGPQRYRYVVPGCAAPVEVGLLPTRQAGLFQMMVGAQSVAVVFDGYVDEVITLTIDGYRQRLMVVRDEDTWWVQTRCGAVSVQCVALLPVPKALADAGGSLRAPMPGQVLGVLVTVGQQVAKGDALLWLEAMKMEHTIRTAADGVVTAIYYGPGDMVAADAVLVEIDAA